MANENIIDVSATKYFDIVYAHRAKRHTVFQECPHCGENVSKIAIVKLVYTYEICDCGTPHYRHLVEQLWHRDCFVLAQGKMEIDDNDN